MTRLSIAAALRAGVSLVKRRPRAAATWVAIYLVVALGPTLVLWWTAGPEYVDFFRDLLDGDRNRDPQFAAALRAKTAWINNLTLFTSWAWSSIAGAAIFGAIVKPDSMNAPYVKIGPTELWLSLVLLVIYVGTFAALLAVTILSLIPTILGSALGLVGGGVAASVAIGALSWGAILCLVLVLAMAMPMTVREGRFRLFDAWRATKGARWKVVLLGLTIILFVTLGIAATFLIQVIAVWTKVAASGTDPVAYLSRPGQQLSSDIVPILTAVTLVLSVPAALFQIVLTAAWGDGFRQLADETAATEDVFA